MVVFTQIVSDYQIIPVVAHSQGGGVPPTYWKSDIVLYNSLDADLLLKFSFLEENVSNSLNFSKSLVLKKKETLILEDVLLNFFEISENKKGAIIITSKKDEVPENPENSKFLCTSRTYNSSDPKGTYGQTVIPGNLFLNSFASSTFLTGLRQDERYRTNIGFLNLSTIPLQINYKFKDSNNNILKEGFEIVNAYSLKQMPITSLGIENISGAFSGEFYMDPSEVTPDPCSDPHFNSFIIYASKVDGNPEGTGDAEFIYGIPMDFPPAGFDCNEELLSLTCTADPTGGTCTFDYPIYINTKGRKGNYIFRWDFGDGIGSDKQNPTHTNENVGTYKPYVIVTDGYTSAFCEQTIKVFVANASPTIDNLQANPNPAPTNSQTTISFYLNDKNSNDSITWEVTLVNRGGGTLSAYSGGPVPPGSLVQITFNTLNPTQAKITITATDASDCKDTEILYVDVI